MAAGRIYQQPGVDLPLSPVLNAEELVDDPHVKARGTVRLVSGPDRERIAVRFPVRFSLGLPDGDYHVAALGEHRPEWPTDRATDRATD